VQWKRVAAQESSRCRGSDHNDIALITVVIAVRLAQVRRAFRVGNRAQGRAKQQMMHCINGAPREEEQRQDR